MSKVFPEGSVEAERAVQYAQQQYLNSLSLTSEQRQNLALYGTEVGRQLAAGLDAAALTAEANPINQGAFVQSWTMQRLGKLESRISALEARVTS